MKPHIHKNIRAMILFTFIFSPASFSQIIYTDPDPDITKTCEALFTTCFKTYKVDIDKDGISDYELVDHILFIYGVGDEMVKVITLNNNQVDIARNDLRVKALQQSTAINGGEQWAVDTSWGNVLAETTGGPHSGHWENNAIRFLGIRLKKGTNYYYGWIRMAVRVKTSSGLGTAAFRVFDYAVNSVPDQPILAGQISDPSPVASIVVNPVLSEEITSEVSLSISPNPVANDILHLKIGSTKSAVSDLIIVNAGGKVLYRERFIISTGSTLKSLGISSLPAGLYYLQVIINDELKRVEFTKIN